MIGRSGIEVPLDTEHARHPALVVVTSVAIERGVDVVVHDLDAQIEVRHNGPHGTRADLPQLPVGTAAGCNGEWSAGAADGRELRACRVTVMGLAVRAVERGPPVRHPPVL